MTTIPGREADVTYGGCTMKLFLDMGVGIGGDKWPAAENFCSLITSKEYITFFRSLISGRRVLELGSGNGLVGILIDKLFQPKEMCITDHPSHMKHIERNVVQNECESTTFSLAYDWTGPVSDLGDAFAETIRCDIGFRMVRLSINFRALDRSYTWIIHLFLSVFQVQIH